MSLVATLNLALKLTAIVGACVLLWTYKRSVIELHGWARCFATAVLALAIAIVGNHYLGQFQIYQPEFWINFDESDVATTFFVAFGIGMIGVLAWSYIQARLERQQDDR